MRIISTWASRPTRPTRPGRFSASYIFWTRLPADEQFSPSVSQFNKLFTMVILNIHRRRTWACCLRDVAIFPLVLRGNGWADCITILQVIGDSLSTVYQVTTCTCTLSFCVSGNTWPIVCKFSEWLGTAWLRAFHVSWLGYFCTCARACRVSISQ